MREDGDQHSILAGSWRDKGGFKRYLIESIGLNVQLDVTLEGSVGGEERMNG